MLCTCVDSVSARDLAPSCLDFGTLVTTGKERKSSHALIHNVERVAASWPKFSCWNRS